MAGYLSDQVRISSALDYASGTADRKGATADMKGWDGLLIIVKTAAIATGATYSIKAQQSATDSDGAFEDVLGTSQTIEHDDDNEIYYIDLYQPRERYVRAYVDKDTSNACAETVIYVQYRGQFLPASQPTGVTGEQHLSPATGTA